MATKHDSRFRRLDFYNGQLTFVWDGVMFRPNKATEMKKGDLVEMLAESTLQVPLVHCPVRDITETWEASHAVGVHTGQTAKHVMDTWKPGKRKVVAAEKKQEKDPASLSVEDHLRQLARDHEGERYGSVEAFQFTERDRATTFSAAARRLPGTHDVLLLEAGDATFVLIRR